MHLSQIVDDYADKRRVSLGSRRRIGYELAMWLRIGGSPDIDSLTCAKIETWRTSAVAAGLRPRTIESVVATVRLLASHAGLTLDTGSRLRHVPTPPAIPSWEQFSRLVDVSPAHLRWWLLFAYVTGLRLGDIEHVTPLRETTLTASKTGKVQRFPVPDCVLRLNTGSLVIPRKRLRRELRDACRAASCPVVTPQIVRCLSAKEWERARPGCGAIILGHALPGWSDATRYYLDPSEQLFLGIDNLRLPASILSATERAASESGESRLMAAFRAMTPDRRRSLVDVASAMQ